MKKIKLLPTKAPQILTKKAYNQLVRKINTLISRENKRKGKG